VTASSTTDGARAAETPPLLSSHRLVKTFGSTTALAGLDFAVYAGEILGLVGANGAGKSTLIAMLSGATTPTSGSILLDGAPVEFATPDAAADAGIATVQQDVDQALVPSLSVAENLVLDQLVAGDLGKLPGRRRIRAAAALVAGNDFSLDLDAPVSTLSTSQKQQLLITRALRRGARVLILDEPTAALSIAEQTALHQRLRALAAAGTAIVYVTHHLGEISAICDRVIAIRDGVIAGDFPAPFRADEVVAAMLGPLAASERVDAAPEFGPVMLELHGVRPFADSPGLSLELHDGEVLGITGLLGAGKTELLRQLVGADRLHAGTIVLDGAALTPRHPADSIARGIGFVPEDRRTAAEFTEWDLADNITVANLKTYRRGPLISRRKVLAAASAAMKALGIVAAGPDAPITSLSGGNRQKAVVSRWLAAGSRLLVLDEPFRGVDLGARGDIAALIRSGGAMATIVASSDPEEILEVADRILVLSGGRLVGEVSPGEVDVDALAAMMIAQVTK
jgi:simple sugar transport system ATP-binding protein